LAVIRNRKLQWPSSFRIHHPQIRAPGQIGGEDDPFSVGRPRWRTDSPAVEEVLDRTARADELDGDVSDFGSVGCRSFGESAAARRHASQQMRTSVPTGESSNRRIRKFTINLLKTLKA
jgi:hypothetical protein